MLNSVQWREANMNSVHVRNLVDLRPGLSNRRFRKEIFNCDVYDNWANPQVARNGAGDSGDGGPMHGFVASTSIVIPANGVVVFAKA